jgi:protein-disulfide isomerase
VGSLTCYVRSCLKMELISRSVEILVTTTREIPGFPEPMHALGLNDAKRLPRRNFHPIHPVITGMATHLSRPVTDEDHTQGPADAPVTLVEYGDYECPHCARAFPLLQEFRLTLGNDLRLVFRHYPINLSHSHAQVAAEAAEGAGAQGKFWEMHAKLFTDQHALDRPSLERYATEIGLDLARFRRELDAGTHRERILRDIESAEESGVHWTPTFFINGVRFGYGSSLDGLLEALRSAAAEANRPGRRGVTLRKGVPQ